jgi:glucose-1-phosphate cytidylyltransferase
MSDVTFDFGRNDVSTHVGRAEAWKVTLVDTGIDTMTGGRLRRLARYIGDEPFCMTYGDGVADVDVSKLVDFHKSEGVEATVTAVRPPGRFGATVIDDSRVVRFEEKPVGDGGWINGGFFVLEPKVIERIDGDETIWEAEPLSGLAAEGQLAAFRHDGFWQPMDTPRDRAHLEAIWAAGNPPWRSW